MNEIYKISRNFYTKIHKICGVMIRESGLIKNNKKLQIFLNFFEFPYYK